MEEQIPQSKEQQLSDKIIAALFVLAEPVSFTKLSKLTGEPKDTLLGVLSLVRENLNKTPMRLVESDSQLELAIKEALVPFAKDTSGKEVNKDLSKASIETLAIVLYSPGISRSEIDYIRGVNSSFILRNLSIRGLVKRTIDAHDSRRYVYEPTTETLRFLGLESFKELENYDSVHAILKETSLEALQDTQSDATKEEN